MSLEERKPYIAKCPRCSQCKWVPAPKSQQFAPICPSIQYGNFHSFSAGGKGVTAYALAEGRVQYSEEMLRSVYACTMCGACDTACKTNFGDNVEPLDTLYALRGQIVEAGHALPAHQNIIENLRREGNPHGKPRGDRDAFAVGLGLKDIVAERADLFLHIGCAAAYDESQWPDLRFGIELLRRAGVDFGIAGNAEPNSGGLAYDIGFQDEALQLARANAELIARTKVDTLVTFCADSYAAFRNIYPRLGVSLGDVRILHISEYLTELLREGRIEMRAKGDAVVTYHDPCKLGRLSEPYKPWSGTWTQVLNVVNVAEPARNVLFGTQGNYDAPRRLIRTIEGVSLAEMERTHEISYCCGAGGGAKEAYPDFAQQTARDRLTEAEATGASVLVTSCSGCVGHLRDAAQRCGSALEVKSLLGLLAETAMTPAAAQEAGE
ncbi:(Fe-S)-binding protein [Sphingobium sp.]|uniref:(Fe-S)-binding protein n=1 Tax=Sphingobium sp. TaxID=1912891 RepID=UPI0028BDAA90|nr:(Fe-S)-binding protein [Sphingobium sp.]